jgi:ribosomal protein S17E
MRKTVIILSVFALLVGNSLQAQKIIPASVSITKEWTDKNGKNILTVRGQDLCNPESEYGAHDGFPSKVEVALVNDKHKLFLTDSLTFDQYQMQTMLIREKEIWTTIFNSAQIVFIPVFFCGTYDLDTYIWHIILYDSQKWLIRVQYLYEIEGNGFFRLNDDLKRKLNFIQSKKLRNKIIKQITEKYKTVEEFESVFKANIPPQ